MSKATHELAEVVLENAEAVAKQLLEEDSLARDIPFVSSALKLLKVSSSISDRILLRKLEKFFGALHEVPEDERNALYQRVLSKPAEAARIGELLLLTIDQLNDLEKPLWVAMMLLGYMDGTLSLEGLQFVCLAIQQTLPNDMSNLERIS
jgi:hypothetical protein